METTERGGLDSMDWTEEQADCRAGRAEKSNPEEERSRSTAKMEAGMEARTEAEMEAESGLECLGRAAATAFLDQEHGQ